MVQFEDVRQCWNKELSLEARKRCLTMRAQKQGDKVQQNAQRSHAVPGMEGLKERVDSTI